MIPVILGLIDAALQTETIRTEIDVGVKDGKEKTRESREAVKKENERWEIERKELEAGAKEFEVSHDISQFGYMLTFLVRLRS